MNIAIVETNKLHLDDIYDQFDILAYSVDSTLTAIAYDQDTPPHTLQIMTMSEFQNLQLTPDWNHDLVQSGE